METRRAGTLPSGDADERATDGRINEDGREEAIKDEAFAI